MKDSACKTQSVPQGGFLTATQQRVYDKLLQFAVVHTLGLQKVCGISTRPYPLIIGPSGAGKTHLVRRLASETKQPLYAINAQNWIVRGARSDAQITTDQLCEFVHGNGTGIILIDEINKLNSHHVATSAWDASVISELIALLDMDERLDAMGFAGLRYKLTDFLIIGAAAFQDEWNNTRKTAIGFVEEADCFEIEAFERAVRDQHLVPDELLYRFNDRILVVPPPRARDLAQRITALRRELHLPALTKTGTMALALEAERSGKMMRWLEGYAALCAQQACPQHIYALAEPERAQSREKGVAAAGVAAEKARQKDYESAYTIYGMYLSRLAESASQTANLVNEIAWLTREPSRQHTWADACQALGDADDGAVLLGPEPNASLGVALKDLSTVARRVCQASTVCDSEHGSLSSEVCSLTMSLRRLVCGLLGPLNRCNVGTAAMDTLQRFLICADCLLEEHRNLEAISMADYTQFPRRGEGDPRRAWLLPPGSMN